jgi:hypothetical protein
LTGVEGLEGLILLGRGAVLDGRWCDDDDGNEPGAREGLSSEVGGPDRYRCKDQHRHAVRVWLEGRNGLCSDV